MSHGGRRPNAGRKKGSGRYGEPTHAMRVPMSRVEEILKLLESPPPESSSPSLSSPPSLSEPPRDDYYWRPLYEAPHSASLYHPSPSFSFHTPFPEPTEKFNLNAYLEPNPESMVFVRMPDMGMSEAGIEMGDLLLVDRGLPLTKDCLVAAIANDELLVRRLMNDGGTLMLAAANPLYPPLDLTGDIDLILLGVVKVVVREV